MRLLVLFIVFFLFSLNSIHAARMPGYQYVFPPENARRVSPQASIMVRFDAVSPKTLSNLAEFISVTANNRPIAGVTKLASDNQTLIFRPTKPFEFGATVHVALTPRFSGGDFQPVDDYAYDFYISKSPAIAPPLTLDDEVPVAANSLQKPAQGGARIMPNGVSVPSNFPHIDVTTNITPGEGYIFINTRGASTPFSIIFDNDGSPVWYLQSGDHRRDFKVQRNGTITMLSGNSFLNFDQNFNLLGEYSAVDGYSTDEHECVITEDGHVLLIGLRGERVDMSAYVAGGQKSALVYETIVQEFTADRDKIFEWRAWDHFADILPSLELEDLRSNSIRFPHMNAIDIDFDGHILLSSRNLSEVSKINRQTGEFIWRLGGPANQFTFVNDPLGGNKNQHAVLSLGNNHYTIFDNGSSRTPAVSRGAEFAIDPANKTATLVWEYRNPQGTDYSSYMGNHQRLPNGNSFINWAVTSRPKATEVTPDGRVVYEMNWAYPDECYRVFRFPWNGVARAPNLHVEPAGDQIILLFNKFGDKNVAYYKIYGGFLTNPTTLLDTSKATLKGLRDLENGRVYYFRVRAVSNTGIESPYSPEQSIQVNLKLPGQNMVLNGDFARSKRNWVLENHNSANSTWTAVGREGHIQITDGGLDRRSIVFKQGQMNLVHGLEYLLEFDARADAARIIEVMVSHAADLERNYSRIGLVALRDRTQHFSYTFTMNEPTDYNADLRFHVGAEEDDVYLNNVVLRENIDVAAEEEQSPQQPDEFKLFDNFPNPFNAQTTIRYQLAEKSRVRLRLYNVRGELVEELANTTQEAGSHQTNFDGSRSSSGLYFYVLEAEQEGGSRFSTVKKMTLIK